MPDARQLLPGERLPAMAAPGAAAGTSLPSTGPSEHEQGASLQPPQLQLLPEQLPLPPPPQQQALSARQPALTQQQQAQAVQQADALATGLDAKLCALASIFELASMATQIDHPLCLDCEAQLKDEMEAQIQESEREVASYAEAVARLQADARDPLPDAEFAAQMRALREEEAAEIRRAAELERQLAAVAEEAAALSAAAADLDMLEERYWHDYNDYQLQLRSHVDERDALLNKIDLASQRLQLLRNTNVFNDAFKIWHDGPFGTISGFRLGRTSDAPVEWEETNAAWGQAVLLLYTMAQACGVTFSCKLLPMGSHPRVADKQATYDLFGPVNKFWSHKYDRAMICYLACLREFGLAAHAEDVSAGKPQPFQFPFAFDGDKVNNYTIKLTLNSDVKWTKALKFMLANLKVALQWMVKHKVAVPAPALQHLGHEARRHSRCEVATAQAAGAALARSSAAEAAHARSPAAGASASEALRMGKKMAAPAAWLWRCMTSGVHLLQ